MTLQQIQYVVAVADTGSINRAAKELFISQSRLSGAVQELEQELGITLFLRTNRGARVTPEGEEFLGEFSAITDPLGAIKENPISHISYSYGAQVIVLNEEGKITKAVSAFDVGTPVNIQSVEGQIEGGMLMGIGYGVTEKVEIEQGRMKSKFGTIGFVRADAAPQLEVTLCRPKEEDKLPVSLGAKGCGELCMIPTAPACALAYYRYDGKFRQSLPLEDTPYRKG